AKDLSQRFATTVVSTILNTPNIKKSFYFLPTSLYTAFWIHLTKMHHDIPDETLAKLNLGPEITKYFNSLYEGYVVRRMATNTMLTFSRSVSNSKSKICLTFFNPIQAGAVETVSAEDVSKLTEAFEKYIKLFIEFAFTDKNSIKQIENEIEWVRKAYEWRQHKLKFDKIYGRLPELKGMFD
ncbi:MAG: hypothetical protein EBR41_04965, partial [Crocinitomicaceae bacterium]|nr:hypothetical protein [Crocinitomicaceae bacterium]